MLTSLVLWQRERPRLTPANWRWLVLLGLLIAAQSFFIYSAVARIPVALALLIANVAPILLVLYVVHIFLLAVLMLRPPRLTS